MRRHMRLALTASFALAAVIALAACGSSKSSSSAATGKAGGTVTITFGTAPDSLDPDAFETTQAGEAMSVDRGLPREEFVDCEHVAVAGLLKGKQAAAHGDDYHGLAADDPAFGSRDRAGRLPLPAPRSRPGA